MVNSVSISTSIFNAEIILIMSGFLHKLFVALSGTHWVYHAFEVPFEPKKKLFFLCYHRSTTSANGCALIFVYMTYTMLPVRLREALFGGMLLSIVHISLSSCNSINVDWLQVKFKWIKTKRKKKVIFFMRLTSSFFIN